MVPPRQAPISWGFQSRPPDLLDGGRCRRAARRCRGVSLAGSACPGGGGRCTQSWREIPPDGERDKIVRAILPLQDTFDIGPCPPPPVMVRSRHPEIPLEGGRMALHAPCLIMSRKGVRQSVRSRSSGYGSVLERQHVLFPVLSGKSLSGADIGAEHVSSDGFPGTHVPLSCGDIEPSVGLPIIFCHPFPIVIHAA